MYTLVDAIVFEPTNSLRSDGMPTPLNKRTYLDRSPKQLYGSYLESFKKMCLLVFLHRIIKLLIE